MFDFTLSFYGLRVFAWVCWWNRLGETEGHWRFLIVLHVWLCTTNLHTVIWDLIVFIANTTYSPNHQMLKYTCTAGYRCASVYWLWGVCYVTGMAEGDSKGVVTLLSPEEHIVLINIDQWGLETCVLFSADTVRLQKPHSSSLALLRCYFSAVSGNWNENGNFPDSISCTVILFSNALWPIPIYNIFLKRKQGPFSKSPWAASVRGERLLQAEQLLEACIWHSC